MKRLWDKGKDIDKHVHAFTVGNDPQLDLQLVRWDAAASAAHALVLHQAKVLSADETKKLRGALKEIATQSAAGKFSIPTELEDCHTAIEARLTAELGDVGRKIHTGRSRNDQVLVAMRLYLKHSVLSSLEALCALAEAFITQHGQLGSLPMPGYTHHQPAMPSSVGMWLGAFIEWGIYLLKDGISLFSKIDSNPLGAASGFGVPLALDRSVSTTALGFASTQRNPMHVQNSRGREELATLRWLSDNASLIEKFSCDLILFSMKEFGFFSLPDALTTGSSIMPQKRNPDVVELLRAQAAKIRAKEDELGHLVSKLPSSYHRDFQHSKAPVMESFELTTTALEVCRAVVSALSANEGNLKNAMSPDLYATYAVYRHVREGMSFREAYQKIGAELEKGLTLPNDIQSDFAIIADSLTDEIGQARQELDALSAVVKGLGENFERVISEVLG